MFRVLSRRHSFAVLLSFDRHSQHLCPLFGRGNPSLQFRRHEHGRTSRLEQRPKALILFRSPDVPLIMSHLRQCAIKVEAKTAPPKHTKARPRAMSIAVQNSEGDCYIAASMTMRT
jgi:hypothetical protein